MRYTISSHISHSWRQSVSRSQNWFTKVRSTPHSYGTHMPHRITQCYLPPGRGDIPAITPPEAGTRLSDPGEMQG